ncbi:MAG: EAL domain-containing protein [Burkholderiales bacterium]|nr:EAL domain-containing protein [Burkholderiales bacterium]
MDRQLFGGFALIVSVALLLAGNVLSETSRRLEIALGTFVQSADEEAQTKLKRIEQLFEHVYEDLRTLASLPSVRAIDRHGVALVGDSRETFQQIYNNLANAVAISEVYLIPADFDPERIDPATGKPEEPIVMFDQLIVDAAERVEVGLRDTLVDDAHEEIEIHEYREFAQQAKWMRENYPRRDAIVGMNVPMIGSKSLITCDNTYYVHSGKDADRMGILLSVPFYGPDGTFKGLVAAIILDRALAAALPKTNATLYNLAYQYSLETDMTSVEASRPHFTAGRPDPDLYFSTNYNIDVKDPKGAWSVWIGRPNADFNTSAEAMAARSFKSTSLTVVAALTLAVGAFWGHFRGERIAAERQARELEEKVASRTKEIAQLALTDPLTGLPNRAMMSAHLDGLESRLSDISTYAVICIDLDRFKYINDTFGHQAGDYYLIALAERMRKTVNLRGTVARWGGDEFIISLEGFHATLQAESIAREVLDALAVPLMIGGQNFIPSASIGIAEAPRDGTVPDELLSRADLALYAAKIGKRGCALRFEPAMEKMAGERRLLEVDLRNAVERRQFVLHYQPIIESRSSKLSGFEALLRWNHPTRGLLGPDAFIPIAEDTGLIIEIGRFVLEEACRAATHWPDQLRVAVNLSPVQVREGTLPLHVASILGTSGLRPDRLELELTENILLDAIPEVLAHIEAIRGYGVRFALDDFGKGYCSLAYLQTFSFDRIKIDRSFIANLSSRPACLAIIRAVTQLAMSLGMQTTAEGVETEGQAAILAATGVTDMQGYLFGRPEPEAAAIARVSAVAAASVAS